MLQLSFVWITLTDAVSEQPAEYREQIRCRTVAAS